MDIVLRSNTSATATTALSPEGAALSAITIGFPLLALVLVVLRIYTRVKLAKLRLDDYLIIVAVVSYYRSQLFQRPSNLTIEQ